MAGIEAEGDEVTFANFQHIANSNPETNLSSLKNSRIPQFKDLIYWAPMIQHQKGKLNLLFYTSEVKGLFEIRIEGISDAGEKISRRKYFEAE